MSRGQVFRQIQIPLAMPVVVAGIRSASIEVIASATLAAFIGVRSLGYFILSGMSLIDFRLLLVGAVPIAILALLAEGILSRVERRLTPPVA
jgi:osmoprotectant transport system permease protein